MRCDTPHSRQNCWDRDDENWGPLSDQMTSGAPDVQKTSRSAPTSRRELALEKTNTQVRGGGGGGRQQLGFGDQHMRRNPLIAAEKVGWHSHVRRKAPLAVMEAHVDTVGSYV